jgi:carboxylesterase type B
MMNGSPRAPDSRRLWTLTEQLDVVSIGIQYRLNAFGFFAHKLLSAESDSKTSGNLGVLDMISALQFIQRIAASFGGDPQRVVIWGQSSGGTGVLMLAATPLARGLFSAGFAMSASPVIDAPLVRAEQYVEQHFISRSKCGHVQPDTAKLDCMRYNLTVGELLGLTSAWADHAENGYPKRDEYYPDLAIVDGFVLKKPLNEALRDSSLRNNVPLVLGNLA